MSRLGASTTERLQDAFMITMDAPTEARHEAAIADAIRSAGNPAPISPSRWKLRVPAIVAAVMVVAPVGAAVAADSANPGDVLYPVKRIVEPIVSIFDSDVVASHRVEELAHIVDEPAEVDRIPAAISDARDALSDLPPDHYLQIEFDLITDRVVDHTVTDDPVTDEFIDEIPPNDGAPSDIEPEVSIPTDEPPTDGETTETTETTIRDTAEQPTTTQEAPERPPSVEPSETDISVSPSDVDDGARSEQDPATDQP